MTSVLNYLGTTLRISSIFLLLPIFFGLYMKENIFLFLLALILLFILGSGFKIFSAIQRYTDGRKQENLTMVQAMTLTVLSYTLIALITSMVYIPYFQGNAGSRIIDSLFESISGFSTTGLTMIVDFSGMPASLLLWRSFTQWIGGIGIITFLIFILFSMNSSSGGGSSVTFNNLFQLQGMDVKIEPSFRKSAITLLKIYGAYTVLGILLFRLAHLSLFDSVNLTFTSLATGGFIPWSSFDPSLPVQIIACVMMILGATSFFVHSKLFKLEFRTLIKNVELRFFLFILVLLSLVGLIFMKSAVGSFFTMVSALTTTGFSIVDIPSLPQLVYFLIILAMIAGGSTLSTAGGIKIKRISQYLDAIVWQISRMMKPSSAVIPFKSSREVIDDKKLLSIEIFITCYFFLLVAGSIVFLTIGYDFNESIFQVASALGSVGMQIMPLYSVPAIGKFTLMLLMLFGRLEIFSVLAMVHYLVKVVKRSEAA